jgi:hypothetical protein
MHGLLGSVAHELIHLAACPVTVIPERMVEPHVPEPEPEPEPEAEVPDPPFAALL